MQTYLGGLEGGAVLREQNALPCGSWITVSPTAKDDVDNVGAGRAAKGANHFAPAVWVFARETFVYVA